MGKYKARRDPDPFPAGRYQAHYLDFEPRDGNYGEYLVWTFKVYCNGEAQTISGITSARFGTRSKEYQFVEVLQGKAPGDGEDIDLEKLRGAPCQVELNLKEGKNGGMFNSVVGVYPAAPSADAIDVPEDDVPF